MTLDNLLSRLEGVYRYGDKVTALCPGHEDSDASLSVTEGRAGRILLKCHAGCTFEQIVAALGLQVSDLMGGDGHKRRAPASAPEKAWTIRNAEGRAIAEHHRIDLPGGKKRIWWTRDNMKGLGRLPTSDLPLYGSENVKDIPPGADIYICEGEKAADALREKGVFALGTVTGADKTPGLESLSVLRGRNVILWPDFDDVGRAHMDRIGKALDGVAARVRFLSWGEQKKDDAFDYFARGRTVEGLASLVEKKSPVEDVKPAELLDAIAAFVRRFVFMLQSQAEILALWIMHTHTFQAVPETPYIWVSSPEKESGKTRLLEVCEMLVARPWLTGRTTAAALVRKVDRDKPTLLLDESDSAFSAEKEYAEALRGILDSGHREDGRSSVCVGQGASIDVRDFSTYCPKAIAGIGKGLPDTVISRSIPIRLRRQSRAERVERFRRRKAKREAAPLRDNIERWAAASLESLRGAEPSMPDGLRDRQEDGGECLIAIADAAGAGWPDRARDALVEICRGAADDDSIGVRLLRDCRAVFDARGGIDRLSSADLCGALVDLEEGPWGELHKGRPLTTRSLARMLNPYGIVPGSIRLDDGRTPKGYRRDAFGDAWERYCASPPSLSATTPQANTDGAFLDFSKRHREEPVADEKREIVNAGAGCGVVADKRPQDEGKSKGGAEEATSREAQETDAASREALL